MHYAGNGRITTEGGTFVRCGRWTAVRSMSVQNGRQRLFNPESHSRTRVSNERTFLSSFHHQEFWCTHRDKVVLTLLRTHSGVMSKTAII